MTDLIQKAGGKSKARILTPPRGEHPSRKTEQHE